MATPERLPEPQEPAQVIDLEVERKRKGKIVQGVISLMRIKDTFTIEEVRERGEAGKSTPLDLMPIDFWHPKELPSPRYGEEMLGKDF